MRFRRRRPLDVARGVAALVVLLVLVVGVPVGLAVLVGWPLPTSVPSATEVSDAITRVGISDTTVVKIVACVLWLAWFQLALGVLAEAAGLARRGTVRSVATLGPFRHLAGSLLASVVVLATSTHTSVAAVPARPIVAVTPTAVPTLETAPASTVESTPAPPTWTVQPRDTLWGIAERTLGRGERWADIRRANLGREVAPGRIFTEGTDVLMPGWTLLLPPDATVAGASTVVVAPGDTLTRLAARIYGDPARWRDLWEVNRGRTFNEQTFDDPNLIRPGWELVVPADSARPPATPSPSNGAASSAPSVPSTAPVSVAPPVPTAVATPPGSAAPSPTATAAPSAPPPADTSSDSTPAPPSEDHGGDPAPLPRADVDDVAAPAPSDSRPAWVGPTGVAGAVLLATGVTGLLVSRRRRRLRHMRLGDALPPLDPDLAPVERAVRLGEDPLGMARVDTALRALLARSDANASRPHFALRRATDDIELVFDGPVTSVPSPWRATGWPERILLPGSVTLEELAADAVTVVAPCPGLVLVGTSDDAELYADVEALGVITLDGPLETTTALARAFVATLAVSPLADLVHIVTSGVDCYGFADEERVHAVSDPDAALDLSGMLSLGVRQALEHADGTHTLRRDAPQEPWEPVIAILLGADLSPAQLADVRRLVASGGVAVVTDAEVPGARYRLHASGDGTWQLEPTGLPVVPRGLAAAELADLGALLADAKAPAVRSPSGPPPPLTDEPFVEPPWELQVRLLGPVAVVNRDGTAAPFERAKALELVAWLAQHRANPTRTGARTAMWESDVRGATFANVVSDARRALTAIASPPEGEEWLARTLGEQLPLHPLVVTDADLLAARLGHARRQRDADAVVTLRPGLAAVSDAPYVGTSWLWPDGEALPSHLTLLVTNAATEMAERCLALGDVDGVFWATAQGMKVLPGHDSLVGLRMHAHSLAGNLAGVRQEYESYERVVTSDPWGDGSPSPHVVELRNRLLAPSRARAR